MGEISKFWGNRGKIYNHFLQIGGICNRPMHHWLREDVCPCMHRLTVCIWLDNYGECPCAISVCIPRSIIIIRAHSFSAARGISRNLGFRGIWAAEYMPPNSFFFLSAEFGVFHSNNYFFTENDLKVALLQVCLWWFFLMVMVEWWNWWLINE